MTASFPTVGVTDDFKPSAEEVIISGIYEGMTKDNIISYFKLGYNSVLVHIAYLHQFYNDSTFTRALIRVFMASLQVKGNAFNITGSPISLIMDTCSSKFENALFDYINENVSKINNENGDLDRFAESIHKMTNPNEFYKEIHDYTRKSNMYKLAVKLYMSNPNVKQAIEYFKKIDTHDRLDEAVKVFMEATLIINRMNPYFYFGEPSDCYTLDCFFSGAYDVATGSYSNAVIDTHIKREVIDQRKTNDNDVDSHNRYANDKALEDKTPETETQEDKPPETKSSETKHEEQTLDDAPKIISETTSGDNLTFTISINKYKYSSISIGLL